MIQKSRSKIKQDLIKRLKDNWEGFSTGVVGKELLALATEIIYQTNITAESLTRPCDIDTASLAELYRLAAAEDVIVSAVEASSFTVKWPNNAATKRLFEVQAQMGGTTFYNTDPCIPGNVVQFKAGKLRTVALDVTNPILSNIAQVEQVGLTKVVDAVDDIDTDSIQQQTIMLGENVIASPILVYASIIGEGVRLLTPTTFYTEATDKYGYRIIWNKAGTAFVDLTELYRRYADDEGKSVSNVEVVYLQGISSAAKFEKDTMSYDEGKTHYDIPVIESKQGTKGAENVRRQLRAATCIRQVINNVDAVKTYAENVSDINSCNVEYSSDKCYVYIKPFGLKNGTPMEGGIVDMYSSLQSNLEYYGYLQQGYICMTAYPFDFKVKLLNIDNSTRLAEVAAFLEELLSYENLKIDSFINPGTISAEIQSELGVTCFLTILIEESKTDIMNRENHVTKCLPTRGTVKLYNQDKTKYIQDDNGKFYFEVVNVDDVETTDPFGVAPNGVGVPTINTLLLSLRSNSVKNPFWYPEVTVGDNTKARAIDILVSPCFDHANFNFTKDFNPSNRSINAVPNVWNNTPIVGKRSAGDVVINFPELNKVKDVVENAYSEKSYLDFIRILTGYTGILNSASESRDSLSPLVIMQNDYYIMAKFSIDAIAGLSEDDTPVLMVWPYSSWNVSNPKAPYVTLKAPNVSRQDVADALADRTNNSWTWFESSPKPTSDADVKKFQGLFEEAMVRLYGQHARAAVIMTDSDTSEETIDTAFSANKPLAPTHAIVNRETQLYQASPVGPNIKNRAGIMINDFVSQFVWSGNILYIITTQGILVLKFTDLEDTFDPQSYTTHELDLTKSSIKCGYIYYGSQLKITQESVFNGITADNRNDTTNRIIIFYDGFYAIIEGVTIVEHNRSTLAQLAGPLGETVEYVSFNELKQLSSVEVKTFKPQFPLWKVVSNRNFLNYAFKTYEDRRNEEGNTIKVPKVWWNNGSWGYSMFPAVNLVTDEDLPEGCDHFGDVAYELCHTIGGLALNAYVACWKTDGTMYGYIRRKLFFKAYEGGTFDAIVESNTNLLNEEGTISRTTSSSTTTETITEGSVNYNTGEIEFPSDSRVGFEIKSVEYEAVGALSPDKKSYFFYKGLTNEA